jgi:hypothetical protein
MRGKQDFANHVPPARNNADCSGLAMTLPALLIVSPLEVRILSAQARRRLSACTVRVCAGVVSLGPFRTGMSYGVDLIDGSRRAGVYAAKILAGVR